VLIGCSAMSMRNLPSIISSVCLQSPGFHDVASVKTLRHMVDSFSDADSLRDVSVDAIRLISSYSARSAPSVRLMDYEDERGVTPANTLGACPFRVGAVC
jgi:hypothetical protein